MQEGKEGWRNTVEGRMNDEGRRGTVEGGCGIFLVGPREREKEQFDERSENIRDNFLCTVRRRRPSRVSVSGVLYGASTLL